MSQLAHNSARVLEFDALRELLRGYASSPLGQAKITALAPSTDAAWIAGQQALTVEVREFRRVGGRFDFSSLLHVTKLIAKSRIAGAVLETTEIRDVLLLVDPRCGVARDRCSSSSEYEDGMAAHPCAFGRRTGLHRVPAIFPEQNSAGWNA